MDKIQQDYDTYLWNSKDISSPDENWFICKIFKTRKQMLPIEEQKKIIETKKKYFWAYIPETQLIATEDWGYIIRLKFIEWKTLAQINISNLPPETLFKILDLIKRYLKYHKEQWWELDITWCQYYEWNPGKLERTIRNFFKINKNFLISTNIMVSDDWDVYMVDVCESTDIRLQSKIKNFLARPFIKRTISNLEKTLKRKFDFWHENISQELLSLL